MRAGVTRVATTAIMAAGIGSMSAMMAAPMADAASPIVVGDCNATVTGKPGQPVSLDVGAVLGMPNSAVVQIGAIPQAGAKTLSGNTAIEQATAPNGPLGGLLGGLSSTVTKVLDQGCTVTAKAVNTAAAPVQKATKPVTDAATPVTKPLVEGVGRVVSPKKSPSPEPQSPGHKPSPGNPPSSSHHPGSGATPPAGTQLPTGVPAGVPLYGQLGDYGGLTTAPSSLYGSLPGAAPAGFTPAPNSKYGLNAPGYAPTFGKLGGPPQQGSDGVRQAGSAEALPGGPQGNPLNNIGLPLLIGVVAISGVTAGLVRAWMLRKTTAA